MVGALCCLVGRSWVSPPSDWFPSDGSSTVLLVVGIQPHLHHEMYPHSHHDGLLVKLVKIAALPFSCLVLEKTLVSHQAHHRNCFVGLGQVRSWASCFSSKLVLFSTDVVLTYFKGQIITRWKKIPVNNTATPHTILWLNFIINTHFSFPFHNLMYCILAIGPELSRTTSLTQVSHQHSGCKTELLTFLSYCFLLFSPDD